MSKFAMPRPRALSPAPIPMADGPKEGDLVVSHSGTVYRVQKGGPWRKEAWEDLTPREQAQVDQQLRQAEEQRKQAARR